ncbi:MAG: outer membrane protein assembly factor BamB family protein, partial [Planctomycetota bacterium]
MECKTPGVYLLGLLLASALGGTALPGEAAADAAAIVELTGVRAGVCARLGTTDGKLEAALGGAGSFIVHGLAADRAALEKARAHLREKGVCGRVSVELAPPKGLPYAGNLVNLLVIEDLAGVSLEEALRVLTPKGALCVKGTTKEKLAAAGFANVKTSGDWLAGFKPRPAEMDDWTHPWHGPDGNVVSRDTLVRPSSQLQWVARPFFGHHRGPIGAVTAGGRLFYVLYDNPLGVILPAKVFLAARDAYNGKLLWKRPLPNTTLLKWGKAPYFKPGMLVAAEDRVFAVLKPGAPLSALDAATGKTVREYTDLPSPQWVVHYGKLLVLGTGTGFHVADLESGKLLWKRAAKLPRPTTDWKKMTCAWKGSPLTVTGDRLFFLEGEKLTCLNANTGEQVWTTDAGSKLSRGKGGLVMGACYRGIVALRGRGGVHAFSTADGKHLWSQSGSRGYGLGGLLWVCFSDKEAKKRGWIGLDLKTGEEQRRIEMVKKLPPDIQGKRILDGQCNHPLATEKYFIFTTRMSLIDTRSGKFHNTMITRASCRFLLGLPANGLLYSFPKDCNCYPCLRGMLAYSPAPDTMREPDEAQRLEKGPAFGKIPAALAQSGEDWPTHRADGQRSSSVPTAIPAGVEQLWSTEIGGRLSAPTIAAGKVFVASVE